MPALDRRPGRVIFTRPGQTPTLHEGIYHLALLGTGLCSALMLFIEPFYGAMAATLCGVVAMAMGLVVMSSKVAIGGRLLQVRKRFELVTAAHAEGYRDAPSEDEIELEDGRKFPKSKVREVVLGHFSNNSGGGGQHDFWPVYLVLDEHVIELAVLTNKSSALKLRREVAELFDVPAVERETRVFGTGLGAGFLNGLVSIGLDLLFLSLPVLVLTTLGRHAAVPTGAVLALLLWMNHRITPSIFARDIRKGIDEQIAELFELGPRVRVDPEEDETVDEAEADASHDAVSVVEP